MKTIGVLGGIGPQATMDFEGRLHRAAQQQLPPRFNTGYPPMIVYYFREPPVLLDEDDEVIEPLQPLADFLEAARWLGERCDFLVITANAAHLLQDHVEAAAGRPVLSMIDLAIAEIRRLGWGKVGVLGLGEPTVFMRPLREQQVQYEVIDDPLRSELDAAIFAVMEGREDESSAAVAEAAVQELRDRDVDGVVLGCTEIPFLLPPAASEPDLLDPLDLLAEACVEWAMA